MVVVDKLLVVVNIAAVLIKMVEVAVLAEVAVIGLTVVATMIVPISHIYHFW